MNAESSRWIVRLAALWAQRTPRERVLVRVMALALGGYLGSTALVQPMLAAQTEARASISRADLALAELAALPDVGAVRPPAEFSDQPVTAIVTGTATEFDMTIRRIETEAGGARLTIEDADFGDVVRWIDALETDYGLRFVAVEMDRRPEPGIVSASLTVMR